MKRRESTLQQGWTWAILEFPTFGGLSSPTPFSIKVHSYGIPSPFPHHSSPLAPDALVLKHTSPGPSTTYLMSPASGPSPCPAPAPLYPPCCLYSNARIDAGRNFDGAITGQLSSPSVSLFLHSCVPPAALSRTAVKRFDAGRNSLRAITGQLSPTPFAPCPCPAASHLSSHPAA